MHTMHKMFDYVNRYFLQNQQGSIRLAETALDLFKKRVFNSMSANLKRAILSEIQKDRENQIIDIGLVRDAIMQYIYMGFERDIEIKIENGV